MADYAPMSELRKPAVCVLIVHGCSAELQPMFWGMEEEGIPYEVQESSSGEVVAVAKEAAHMSPLNVGIAFDGVKGTIALHHRDLKPDEPLFVLNFREVKPGELRRLGINAARLVKSEPLVLTDELQITNTTTHSDTAPENVSDALVAQIVERILAELVKA
jgi:propanediol dehydratase-reactivating factor small subunit